MEITEAIRTLRDRLVKTVATLNVANGKRSEIAKVVAALSDMSTKIQVRARENTGEARGLLAGLEAMGYLPQNDPEWEALAEAAFRDASSAYTVLDRQLAVFTGEPRDQQSAAPAPGSGVHNRRGVVETGHRVPTSTEVLDGQATRAARAEKAEEASLPTVGLSERARIALQRQKTENQTRASAMFDDSGRRIPAEEMFVLDGDTPTEDGFAGERGDGAPGTHVIKE